jgi:poly-gamma-glutamate capsule biosynthesis protein CapA/YwtB (metallophosphatase superfamily)
MVNILIGADLCPIGGNLFSFKAGDANALFNELLGDFEAADLVIANLECPLIEQPAPILKTGPVFGEASACINGIKQAGIDVLGLANNHIMDHGATGLQNTMEVCRKAGIATVGAGENLASARRILIKEVHGLRLGIMAVAEHEFSIATKDAWGANPADLIDFVRNVRSQSEKFDYLIVLFHGGDEFHVPSPRIKDTCHFMIEMGANAVIVQHSHCLGGYEEYRGGHIVYGQGALVMDEEIYRNRESFHEGFLVRLLIASDATSKLEIVPFIQSRPAPGARKMESGQEREFRRELEEKSTSIRDDYVVEKEWIKFCEERKHDYLSCLLGHNRILSKLNVRGLLERFMYGKLALLRTRNLVCCETHREAIETIFSRRLV